MSALTFIFRPWDHRRRRLGARYATADGFRATYPEITRAAKRQPFPGLARVIEGTGRHDKSRVTIRPLDVKDRADDRAFFADGTSTTGRHFGTTVATSAAGVKGALRRIRDLERAEIEALDVEIASKVAALNALRARRAEAVDNAWKRAHVVTLADVKATARNERGDGIPV